MNRRNFVFTTLGSGLLLPGVARAQVRPAEAPPIETVVTALGVDLMPGRELTDAQKETAKTAGQKLISLCPKCRLGTIDEEGPCGWARTNRTVIRNAAHKGMSADEIIAVYVKTYGENVLAIPNDKGFAMASWMVPYAGIGASFVFLFFIGSRLRKRKQEAEAPAAAPEKPPEPAETEAEKLLKQELAELD